MIRVVIVGNDVVFTHRLQCILEHQPDIKVVSEYADGKQAVERVIDLLPDILLLDLLLPDKNSIAAILEVKRIVPSIQVIVLATCYADEQILQVMKAGACSCLLKNSHNHELIEAIYAAAQGECKLHPTIATRILREVHHCEHSPINNLTARELHILTDIARGRSHQEIAVELTISEQIVSTHVANILSKLHLTDRTRASVYALQQHLVSVNNVQK